MSVSYIPTAWKSTWLTAGGPRPIRTAATRAALVAAARRLFAEHGYGDVGTEQIAHAAGVTPRCPVPPVRRQGRPLRRGAGGGRGRPHGPPDRRRRRRGHARSEPLDLLVAGADAWLDASAEPEVRRIALLDGPAVLGWERWREVGMRHGLGLVKSLLTELIDAGGIPAQPIDPLAHVLIGALDEAALYVALADDPARARAEAGAVLRRFVRAVTAPT